MMQVTKVWWDGEKLITEPIDPTTIYQEPVQQEPDFWEGYVPEPVKPAQDNSNYRLDPPGLDPLYTSPPQRKPLTLGQKQRLWSSVGDKPTLKDRVNAYGLAIEAAHGIKENT